jgi:hypothetical protein
MNDLINESFDIVNKNGKKGENFKQNIFLVKVNTIQEGLKAKLSEIKKLKTF